MTFIKKFFLSLAALVTVCVTSAKADSAPTIHPGAVWPDDRGQHINAHGGGITQVGDTWYWFGEYRPRDAAPDRRYVSCYSSTNLVNWKFCGLPIDMTAPEGIGPNWVLERPKVFYNAKTKKFVMYLHLDGPLDPAETDPTQAYKLARVGVAVADTVAGPYHYVRSFRPLGQESRDIGQFIDDDGSAYLIFESRPTQGFFIAKLSDDYLDVAEQTAFIAAPIEGGALVHYDGLYYILGSALTGWRANPNQYATAKDLKGPWSGFKDIAPPETRTYDSQSTLLLKVVGTNRTTVIFMGDQWKPDAQWDSRYLWMPLEIGGGRLWLPKPQDWTIDVRSGAATLAASQVHAATTIPSKQDVLQAMELANNYFLAKWPTPGSKNSLPGKRPSNIWTRGVYFEGALALYQINQDPAIRRYAVEWATFHDWNFRNGITTTNPDDQCVGQAYLGLYQLEPSQPGRIAHVRANLDHWVNGTNRNYYTWIDTFQMSMPCFATLGVLDRKPEYFDTMFALYDYAKTGLGLYNPKDRLWWRDVRFKPPFTTPNGKPCYWSRGNGWVVGALVRVLSVLPATDPHRAEYLKMFQDMSAALLPLQRDDGFWNVDLGDPDDFGGPESTGTALFIYGMAWGINHGYLPADTYLPAVAKGWQALATQALHPNGFLGYVQGTGHKPADGQPVTYDSVPDFEDYGLGCFLLAGSEVHTLAAAANK